ncbi:hypothetical protein PHMEG_0007930 [Phytophthora megakarya]|uniref:Uncharacterized protein n=1 Tax=Phytophthora megakarya TaxID=4795 RepID=A0A225WK88_9STRA|nr:hypothetical protein PHMEG_0007930 [Phytophthora megakarya]
MSAAKRTPVSSPVSASTSESTPVVDTTSVPASAHVLAVTPTPLNGTTEKNFSVEKYFSFKRGSSKSRRSSVLGTRSQTVLGLSSMVRRCSKPTVVSPWTTRMESLKTRSPRLPSRMSPSPQLELVVKTIRTLPRRSVREVQVMQQEALAISSERDATRTDDTVREPWMPSESVIKDRYGALVPPNEIPLYFDNRIVDDAEAAAKHYDNLTNLRRDYYISRFHELRY